MGDLNDPRRACTGPSLLGPAARSAATPLWAAFGRPGRAGADRSDPPDSPPTCAARSVTMDVLANLYLGFSVALTPPMLVYAFLGCVIGTLVGMLPGLGPLAGISLLLPVTFGLEAHDRAGAARRRLLRRDVRRLDDLDPDAHPGRGGVGDDLRRRLCDDAQGRAGPALAIAAIGSFVAGTFGVVGLMLLAPTLAAFALRFGPPEYHRAVCLGLFMLAYMSSGSMPEDARDGGARPDARHDRHRRDERLHALRRSASSSSATASASFRSRSDCSGCPRSC